MAVPKEDIEAEMLANWLRSKNYTFTHVANESGLPPKVAMLAAKKKKRMWLSPWFPDFIVLLKRKSMLLIELKRRRDYSKTKWWKAMWKASHEQMMWIEELNTINNIWAYIAEGSEEAKKIINRLEHL